MPTAQEQDRVSRLERMLNDTIRELVELDGPNWAYNHLSIRHAKDAVAQLEGKV